MLLPMNVSLTKEQKQTVGDDEPIFFIDAVRPTQSTKTSHGWICKDQDKLVKTTGSRTRLNLVRALNLNDLGATVIREYGSIKLQQGLASP